jgi:hypothetical protein
LSGEGMKKRKIIRKKGERKDYSWIDYVLKMKIKRWKMNGKSVRTGKKGQKD